MSSKRFMLCLTVLVMLALSLSAASAAQFNVYVFEFRTDPVLAVASYYNVLNAGDYARAYNYWENVPNNATLAQFTAGFADTERVAAYMGAPVMEDAGAGNVYAQVPVLVAAAHTDGSLHNFTGCITVHRSNVPVGDATEPDPNWSLNRADVTEVADFDFALLETACPDAAPVMSPFTAINTPLSAIAAYYDAVNLKDYARAYAYWPQAPDNATLAQFTSGFADTKHVSLIIRADGLADGAAGSSYVSLPVLLRTTHNDDKIAYYGGCFTTRHSNVPVGDATEPSPDWHLFDADLTLQPDVHDGFALLDGACFEEVEAVG